MVKTGAVLVTREISTFLFAAGLGSGLASGIEPLNFIVTSLVKHILDAEDWQLCHARKEELIR
ncbi:MAG: hypothetical protein V7L14_18925 [Nostoc sp.]|uniref:hypothetical protein n=1 Tax=Nostoc sp. TaxID=1180 RepID=UPI002FF44A0A